MTSVINYLVEVNAGLLLLLVFYYLLLRKETNFTLIRFFMLVGIVASIVFPLLHLGDVNTDSLIQNALPEHWLPEIVVTGNEVQVNQTNAYPVWSALMWLYFGGVALALFIFIVRVVSLLGMMRKHESHRYGRYRIVESSAPIPTFSFFNFICIGNAGTLAPFEKERIIQHETVHATQLHSLDVILVNLLSVALWFNPFIILYKKIFVQLHEFEADARAVENTDAERYCKLLAKVALQSAQFQLANHFNNSLTLKRIDMIRSIKFRIQQWKLAAVTAFLPALFFVLACNDQLMAQEVRTQVPPSESNEIFMVVDQMPDYPGGKEELGSFLASELRYPKEARRAGIQGTSFIQFIVEKDGTLSDVKLEKGFDSACDAEALRVIKMSKPWNPGVQNGKSVRTKMVVPIKFKLG